MKSTDARVTTPDFRTRECLDGGGTVHIGGPVASGHTTRQDGGAQSTDGPRAGSPQGQAG